MDSGSLDGDQHLGGTLAALKALSKQSGTGGAEADGCMSGHLRMDLFSETGPKETADATGCLCCSRICARQHLHKQSSRVLKGLKDI